MTRGWGGNWHLMALWGCSDSCLSFSGCQVVRLALLLWGGTWSWEHWPLLSVTAPPHPPPAALRVDHPACAHYLQLLGQCGGLTCQSKGLGSPVGSPPAVTLGHHHFSAVLLGLHEKVKGLSKSVFFPSLWNTWMCHNSAGMVSEKQSIHTKQINYLFSKS